MDQEAGALHAIEWDDLNEYAIQLRTAANLLSGIAVEAYVAEMVEWAQRVLATIRKDLAVRQEGGAP